jgi:hypothetical protein
MNILLDINGGLGKNIASTAFCARIKKKYPESKLIVFTFWKDAFLNNPNVDVCLEKGEDNDFYEKYVEGQEILFLVTDPYLMNAHMNKKEHLIQTWFSMIGEEYNDELPELYFTKQEKQYYNQFFKFPKDVFIIQANGGGKPQQGMDSYNWARDIPPNLVQKIIDKYSEDYSVGVIRQGHQIKYNNCLDFRDKWRMLAIGMKSSNKRLFIDSSFQHVAAALNLPSTVLWSVTDPKVFGYKIHDNILANPHTKYQKPTDIANKFRFVEPLQNMPYESFNEVFNFDSIIKSINRQ